MAQRSGRLQVRMPASLHDELVQAAAADGVSLNQYVCSVLAGAVRWKTGEPALSVHDGEVGRKPHDQFWEFWRQDLLD